MDAIDADALARLREDLGDESIVTEVVDAFLRDTPPLVASIRDALERRAGAEAARLAHSLKSTSATFGARGLTETARDLEHAATHDPAAAALLVTRLDIEFARAHDALRKAVPGST